MLLLIRSLNNNNSFLLRVEMQFEFTATRWQQTATHLLNVVFGEDLWETQCSHLSQCLEERM